jgi:hypothetical protein
VALCLVIDDCHLLNIDKLEKRKKNKTKKTQISHINLCAKYEIIISQKWQTLNPIAKFPNV